MTNNKDTHISIYDVQQNTQTTEYKTDFPYNRLVIGALLGGTLAYFSIYNMGPLNYTNYTRDTVYPFVFYFFLVAVIGLIPMLIAYNRQIKKADLAYWFSFVAMCAPGGIIWFIIGLCIAIFGKKIGTEKEQFKIEIVNDEKYINLKSKDRIEYLNGLKKQIVAELINLKKELKAEEGKLKDIPVDIAKYIKPKDTSSLQKDILQLENKKLAIDELIDLEVNDKNQKREHEKLKPTTQSNNCVKVSVGTHVTSKDEKENGWQYWD